MDPEAGTLRVLPDGPTFTATPLPPFALEIRRAGGLLPWALAQQGGASATGGAR